MDTRMSSRHEIIVLFFAVFALLLLPNVLRFWAYNIDGIIGTPTYFHQRIAEDIAKGNFSFYDEKSFGGRFYSYPPTFAFTLAFFILFLGSPAGGIIFLALAGAATAVVFYFIAKEFVSSRLVAFLLALTPGFIYLFSHLSSRSPPIFLGLLSLYLIIKKSHWLFAALPLGVSFLFHPETGMFFSVVILLYSAFEKKAEKKYILKIFLTAAIIALLWYVPFLAANGFPQPNGLHAEYRERGASLESLGMHIFEFNGYGYFPLLVAVLTVFGLAKTKNNFLRAWFIAMLIPALLFERFSVYLIFPLVMLAASGINAIKKRRIVFSALAIYVVFSGLLMINNMAVAYPHKEHIDACAWIEKNTPGNSTILADWERGHWIAGIAERKNYIDGYAEYAPDMNERLGNLNTFYRNCSLPEGISYIYMERWFIEAKNITCMDSKKIVYEKGGAVVFAA